MTPGSSQFSSSNVTRGSGGAGGTAPWASNAFWNTTSIRCVHRGAVDPPSFLEDVAAEVLFALFLFGCFNVDSADDGVELAGSAVAGPGDVGSAAGSRVELRGMS